MLLIYYATYFYPLIHESSGSDTDAAAATTAAATVARKSQSQNSTVRSLTSQWNQLVQRFVSLCNRETLMDEQEYERALWDHQPTAGTTNQHQNGTTHPPSLTHQLPSVSHNTWPNCENPQQFLQDMIASYEHLLKANGASTYIPHSLGSRFATWLTSAVTAGTLDNSHTGTGGTTTQEESDKNALVAFVTAAMQNPSDGAQVFDPRRGTDSIQYNEPCTSVIVVVLGSGSYSEFVSLQ
uniref:Citrate-sodium symporter n=1 Tax=Lygus hesperus TaxID=30085 RepID=A0A0A9Y7P4_LYGHE